MQIKKLINMVIVAFSSIFFATSAAFAAGEGGGPAAFNGTVFGLLLFFVVGLAAIVLYGSTKTSDTKEVKGVKTSPKNRKR